MQFFITFLLLGVAPHYYAEQQLALIIYTNERGEYPTGKAIFFLMMPIE